MKTIICVFICAMCIQLFAFSETQSVKPASVCKVQDVDLRGYLGGRMDDCIENNLKKTDGMYLVAPFRSKEEVNTWQTEFWGKWMHAAVPLYIYTQDKELKDNIDTSVKELIKTQRTDGYIGNYTDKAQLDGPWDIWGRKYTMLGLLHYYDLTGDKASLNAACRVADHLMTQVGEGKKDIYKVGSYHGMASCSVLEAVLWLYKRANNDSYLKFADYIVTQMEVPEDSAKLLTKALNHVDVGSRFPHPQRWWSWENGQKAYEMMSCYQGLLEYYMITGRKEYLDAVDSTAKNIIATEINAAGSGAAFECWYHGKEQETIPAFHMMETCVTTTWLRLCETLLRLTGDPVYADCIEQALFNAYLASLARDGSTFSKYCPLEGKRGKGEDQCRMKTNCCIANGPRGFVALLESILMAGDDMVMVNLYHDCKAVITIPNTGNAVTIEQKTEYPEKDTVAIKVLPSASAEFNLKLRIPAWSQKTTLLLNGKPVEDIIPGKYVSIKRTWIVGDEIGLKLDLSCRKETKNNHFVLKRGPITLARDTRFQDGNIHEVVSLGQSNQPVDLKEAEAGETSIWMNFTKPLRVGTDLEGEDAKKLHIVHFCDFASAGNTWDDKSLYRVWQREAMNVMHQAYVPYNPPAGSSK